MANPVAFTLSRSCQYLHHALVKPPRFGSTFISKTGESKPESAVPLQHNAFEEVSHSGYTRSITYPRSSLPTESMVLEVAGSG